MDQPFISEYLKLYQGAKVARLARRIIPAGTF
nr:MAG TPA: hypothetical protein [Caudoviricetes sp.]